MITVIAYHRSGYEVQIQTEDHNKIGEMIDWLDKHGYRPQRGFEWTPEGLPVCPKHGVPMTRREKQGDEWFSHNVGTKENPLWCRGYRHKSSPGWEYGD